MDIHISRLAHILSLWICTVFSFIIDLFWVKLTVNSLYLQQLESVCCSRKDIPAIVHEELESANVNQSAAALSIKISRHSHSSSSRRVRQKLKVLLMWPSHVVLDQSALATFASCLPSQRRMTLESMLLRSHYLWKKVRLSNAIKLPRFNVSSHQSCCR